MAIYQFLYFNNTCGCSFSNSRNIYLKYKQLLYISAYYSSTHKHIKYVFICNLDSNLWRGYYSLWEDVESETNQGYLDWSLVDITSAVFPSSRTKIYLGVTMATSAHCSLKCWTIFRETYYIALFWIEPHAYFVVPSVYSQPSIFCFCSFESRPQWWHILYFVNSRLLRIQIHQLLQLWRCQCFWTHVLCDAVPSLTCQGVFQAIHSCLSLEQGITRGVSCSLQRAFLSPTFTCPRDVWFEM